MNPIFKYILRFFLLVLLQAFVLDKIRLHELITPSIYFVFLLWLPFRTNRVLLMILALALGYTLDMFRHHPGFHAAACVLLAYVRPFVIRLLLPKDVIDGKDEEPSIRSMGGWMAYLFYISILTLIHHAWLYSLEAWQFNGTWYVVVKTLASAALSLCLILTAELLFSRTQKFRSANG
jgi:rod shape-determining protein MreD